MPPQPLLRPGPVAFEGPASQPLHNLQSELLAAKLAWDQLGVRIVKGYKTAYGLHETTLKKMEAAKKSALSNDALVFVLSIVAVGISGGLMGSVLAPWVEKAGPAVAKKVFRASVVAGVGTQALQTVTDAGVKKLWSTDVPGDPYKPSVPDTQTIDLEIRDRTSAAFGPIFEALDAMIATANGIQAPVEVGQTILNNFRLNCPLLTDKPWQAEMPTEKQAADAAELAMWVIWANQRDWTFWDSVYSAMDAGWQRANDRLNANDYVKPGTYARDMDPIGDRLAFLNRWMQTLSVVRYYEPSSRVEKSEGNILYTDLRKLRALRLDDGTLPFRRLSGLHMQWDKMQPFQQAHFLTRMADVKPIYKN